MGGSKPEFEAIWKARREHAKALVANAAERLRDSGLNATPILKEGDPKSRIIDLATEWHADLIVLGSHGRKSLNRFLMGSVSEAVARHAPCSVEIVRIPTESAHLSVSPNEMPKDVGVARGSSQIPTATESKRRKRVCNLCGKPSEDNICPRCADRIRAEAVARKKREDKGEE
jgi:K+-sensing histidine kinase KdpD